MALSSKWYQGLSGADKEARLSFIRNHAEVLELLVEILRKDYEEALATSQGKTLYDHAAWAYEQADANGVLRTYRSIIDLVDLTKD